MYSVKPKTRKIHRLLLGFMQKRVQRRLLFCPSYRHRLIVTLYVDVAVATLRTFALELRLFESFVAEASLSGPEL